VKTSTLRLEDCGDTLTLRQYCAWRGLSESTVRRQVRRGDCFVTPCKEKPHLEWRRVDCEHRLQTANVVRERQQRAKAQLQAVG